MLFRATRIAAEAHDGQFRKGSRVPYLVHPLRVAAILSHAGLGDSVVTAAILHDTVEDTSVTMEDLRSEFPPEVCDLVASATETDKSAPWETRKTRTLELIDRHSPQALCLVCADKIDNLESLAENLEVEGETAWSRFSRGREKQRWFYTTMLANLQAASARFEGETGVVFARLTDRLAAAVERVFPSEYTTLR